jgi:hypothetical protein
MRRLVAWGVVLLATVASCASGGVPRAVDERWIARCEGKGSTNVYGLTRERACFAAGKGYEDAKDPAAAASFYKRACDAGNGEACVDWSRLLLQGGNVEGARFVLSSQVACDTARYAGPCGWALIASYEKDEPTRQADVRPVLRRMCDVHKVRTACAQLESLHDVRPTAVASVNANVNASPAPSAPPDPISDAGAITPRDAAASAAIGVPTPSAPATCHVETSCVTIDVARDQGPCEGSLRMNVANHCDKRVYCQWCQAKGTSVVDRSTCGAQSFEVGQTYRGVVSFCERASRGENVVYTCADADDSPACAKI